MIFASREALKSSGFNANKTLAKVYEGLIFAQLIMKKKLEREFLNNFKEKN